MVPVGPGIHAVCQVDLVSSSSSSSGRGPIVDSAEGSSTTTVGRGGSMRSSIPDILTNEANSHHRSGFHLESTGYQLAESELKRSDSRDGDGALERHPGETTRVCEVRGGKGLT